MQRKYWIVLLIMVILSPLGLIAEGTAWGEWSPEDIYQLLGHVPQGMNQAKEWWQAVFPDYTLAYEGEGKLFESIGYMCSAIIGSCLIYGLVTVYGKIAAKKNGAYSK